MSQLARAKDSNFDTSLKVLQPCNDAMTARYCLNGSQVAKKCSLQQNLSLDQTTTKRASMPTCMCRSISYSTNVSVNNDKNISFKSSMAKKHFYFFEQLQRKFSTKITQKTTQEKMPHSMQKCTSFYMIQRYHVLITTYQTKFYHEQFLNMTNIWDIAPRDALHDIPKGILPMTMYNLEQFSLLQMMSF